MLSSAVEGLAATFSLLRKMLICTGLAIGTRHRGEGFYSGAFYSAMACPLASVITDRKNVHSDAVSRWWAPDGSSSALDWRSEDGRKFIGI